MKKAFILIFLFLSVFFFLVPEGSAREDEGKVFISFSSKDESDEKVVGFSFDQKDVEMVALYKGNNLYLLSLSGKTRLLFGKGKAVKTKTLCLSGLVAEEVVRGTPQKEFSVLLSGKKSAGDFQIVLFDRKKEAQSAITGKFSKEVGDQGRAGIVLFGTDGRLHVYQFQLVKKKLFASLHILTKEQYKAARKSVEGKLKAAGQTSAAKKVGKL